jgi:hypothetical protein
MPTLLKIGTTGSDVILLQTQLNALPGALPLSIVNLTLRYYDGI